MIPKLDMEMFKAALAFSTAALAMAKWWRRDSDEEDAMIADCHDMVLNSISDADATKWEEVETGENWRDQLTVEEAEELNTHRSLLRWGKRRN